MNTAATSPAVSLDAAVEAITVAVELGMNIPAIQGVTIHEGSFTLDEYSWHRHGEEYSTPACNSLASVRAFLVNEALSQIVKLCSEDSRFADKFLFRADKEYKNLEEYLTSATDDDVLNDYATHFQAEIRIWETVITGNIPQRLTPQEFLSEDGKPLL